MLASKLTMSVPSGVSAPPTTDSYWVSTWGGTAAEKIWDNVVDSNGNVFVAGETATAGAGGTDGLLAKYNNQGVIQWQQTFGGGGSIDVFRSIVLDSAGNIAVAGLTNSAGAGSNDCLIVKYNANGDLQWQRTLGSSTVEYAYGIDSDLSNNLYIVGSVYVSANYKYLIAKYDTNGTLQWQKAFGNNNFNRGEGIAVDSAGNVYITGWTTNLYHGNNDFLIAKYDTNGTYQWSIAFGGSVSDQGAGIAVDSSSNVYVVGYSYSVDGGATGESAVVAKYDTNGNLQWQRAFIGAGVDRAVRVSLDSNANVYICGLTSSVGAGSNDFLIAKYDTNGNLQWQRTFGGTSVDEGTSISCDSNDNIYISGKTSSTVSGNDQVFIAKLPNDGTLTGTYGVFTYQESNLTPVTSTLGSASVSITDYAVSLTSGTPSLTSKTLIQKFTIA